MGQLPRDPPKTGGSRASVPDLPALVVEPAFVRSVVAMFIVDEELTILVANPAAHLLLGVADLSGRAITEFHTPESADPARLNAARLKAGLVDVNEREGSLVSASGARLVVTIRIDPLLDDRDGRFRLVQMRDITAIREHHRALAAGERACRDVVENLPNCTVLSFDTARQILVLGGALIQRFGYDVSGVQGRRVDDVLPPTAVAPMEKSIHAALQGEATDIEVTSEQTGARYRVRGRPLRAEDGRIVGGFILSEDVSQERLRQAQLEQMQQLSHVGSCLYDSSTGWDFDDKLLELLGVDTLDQAMGAFRSLVVHEDRERTMAGYAQTLATGGRVALNYRFRHGRTGEVRHVRSTCDSVVDPNGKLLRAMVTHADVTEAVYSRQTAEAARAAAAQQRTVLIRRISDLLANDRRSVTENLKRITDVAVAGLGDGAVLRIMSPNGAEVESTTVAHRDPALRELLTTVTAGAGASPDRSGPADEGVAEPGLRVGRPLAGTDATVWADAHGIPSSPALHEVISYFVVAPVRHAGSVLGVLSVLRSGSAPPYAPDDVDLVQVLADRVGAAVAESRAQRWAEQQRRERTAIAGRLLQLTAEQRELLDELTEVEERERVLLAEAIHDDPMQLIIAAAMRLETLGLRSGAPDEVIEELIVTLEAAVERLRTLITALSPPDMHDGLGPALRRLAKGIFVGTGTAVHCVGPDHVALSAARKQTAYRILREALVNARRHARATNVELALAPHGPSVVITVSDDGVGAVELASASGHLGMTTMHARAAAEGCTLTVRSAPGCGTTVTLVVPMDGPGAVAA